MKGLDKLQAKVASSETKEGPFKGNIMTCIGVPETLSEESWEKFSASLHPTVVDYYEKPETLSEIGQKNNGIDTYVISALDSSNKKSERYADCTGIVAVGVDTETQQNISILSHEDPKSLDSQFSRNHRNAVLENRKNFKHDLVESLEVLSARCDADTIDIVIFGGQVADDYGQEKYREHVRFLGEICQETLGIDPIVVIGPNQEGNFDNDLTHDKNDVRVVFDTSKRRLYMERPEQRERGRGERDFMGRREETSNTNVTFRASEIDRVESENWYNEPFWEK